MDQPTATKKRSRTRTTPQPKHKANNLVNQPGSNKPPSSCCDNKHKLEHKTQQQQQQQQQRPFVQTLEPQSLSTVPRWSTDTRHLWKDAARRRTGHRSIRLTDTFYDRDALLLTLDQHGRHLIEKMAFCMRPRSLRPDEALTTTNINNTTTTTTTTTTTSLTQAASSRRQCGPVLSQAAIELLSGQLTGPNMRRIDLECHLETETTDTLTFDTDVTRVFEQPGKDEETLLQLEGEHPRRRLLAATWRALAANAAVRELSVDGFVPVWASSFHTPAFRAFLGRLERLDVRLFGAKHVHGARGINTVPAYVDSLQSILKVLFLHCAAVTSLALHASQHAPLGAARGHFHIPLSLKATQLPRLEHLSLKNCFIGFELAHFLNGHMHTLTSLELLNCYSYRGTDSSSASSSSSSTTTSTTSTTTTTTTTTTTAAVGMAWAPFLEMITRPGMQLRRLEIYDDYIPLTFEDERLDAYNPDKAHEPRDVKDVRRAQMKNPKLRLFLYGFLRDYSGEPWMNKEAIVASFEAREDQAAYEKLMAVVEQNNHTKKKNKKKNNHDNTTTTTTNGNHDDGKGTGTGTGTDTDKDTLSVGQTSGTTAEKTSVMGTVEVVELSV